MDLKSAKTVITGGASGLGFATAEKIIGAGGHAVLLDVNEEHGMTSAAQLGDRALFVGTDVSDEDAVKAAIQTASEFMDGITLTVNCAGIATAGRTLGREGPWPARVPPPRAPATHRRRRENRRCPPRPRPHRKRERKSDAA